MSTPAAPEPSVLAEPTVLVERVTHGERAPGLPILEDVSLAAGPGALVVVEGRSGSGKSTLCQLVAGLEAPDHGRVLVCGEPAHTVQDWAAWRCSPSGSGSRVS